MAMALDLLGTRAFLPAVLAQVTGASPSPLPLDPVVFQSILLVLAAGQRRHLILKAVDPEEVGIVARIAEWTLSTVFNLPTHRLKIRPPRSKSIDSGVINPAVFLRSLFLSQSSSSTETSYDEKAPTSESGRHSRKHNDRHGSDSRTASGYSDPFSDNQTPLESPRQLDSTLPSSSYSHARHSRPLSSQYSKSKSKSRITTTTMPRQIPTALVISGLEHASDISQRALVRVLADGRVVLPRNMDRSGDDEKETWDLPENFVMVYVTSWDLQERPEIHKSLLDKFAMSTNIVVQSKTKHALRSISTSSAANPFSNSPHFHSRSIPSTPLSALYALPPQEQSTPLPQSMLSSSAANPFSTEHHHVSSNSTYRASQPPPRPRSASPFLTTASPASDPVDPLLHPMPGSSPEIATATVAPNIEPPLTPALSATFLSHLRHTTANHTHISPSLNLYLQDLFTAARLDSPELDGTLLTARAMEDAEMLARACRVLGTELHGWELIRGREHGIKNEQSKNQDEEAAGDGGEDGSSSSAYGQAFETGYDPSESVIIDIGIGDITGNNFPQKPAIETRKGKETRAERFPGPSKVAFDETIWSRKGVAPGVTMFDVSEADVARIVPRVISHRVRMRDDWTDEVLAGAVCGEAFSVDTDGEDTCEFKSRDKREGQGGREDLTVKDILVRILQKV